MKYILPIWALIIAALVALMLTVPDDENGCVKPGIRSKHFTVDLERECVRFENGTFKAVRNQGQNHER